MKKSDIKVGMGVQVGRGEYGYTKGYVIGIGYTKVKRYVGNDKIKKGGSDILVAVKRPGWGVKNQSQWLPDVVRPADIPGTWDAMEEQRKQNRLVEEKRREAEKSRREKAEAKAKSFRKALGVGQYDVVVSGSWNESLTFSTEACDALEKLLINTPLAELLGSE